MLFTLRAAAALAAACFAACALAQSAESVVVENKSGAGGNIAAQQIALSPPDGYTMHLSSVGPMSVAPHLVKNLGFDPKRDIAPITMGVVFPNVLIVGEAIPAKTLAEFVALAKQKPGDRRETDTLNRDLDRLTEHIRQQVRD